MTDYRIVCKNLSDDQSRILRVGLIRPGGNPKKAEKVLGWKPQVKFKQLVKIMVETDLKKWKLFLGGKALAWDAPNHSHEMDVIARNVTKDAYREAGFKKKGWKKLLKKQIYNVR